MKTDKITSIKMIDISPISNNLPRIMCTLVGYSSGSIFIINASQGKVLLKQRLHDTLLLGIKQRTFPTLQIIDENY